MKTKHSLLKKAWIFSCVFTILFSSLLSMLPAGQVSAIPVVPPGTTLTAPENIFLEVAQNCQNVSDINTNGCSEWQNRLNGILGNCTNNSLFYQVQQNNAGTVSNVNQWFVNEGSYKSCYNKASSSVTLLASTTCSPVVNDSVNWGKCQDAQNELKSTLGCSGQMFTPPNGSNTRSVKQTALSSCQSKLQQIGGQNLKAVDSSGNVTTDSNPVSSSQVSTGSSGNGTGSGSNNGGSGSGSGSPGLSCDGSFNDPLTWILCPIMNLLSSFIGVVDNWITSELTVNSSTIFGGGAQASDFHDAWSSFRDIALGLMVMAGIIMLIAHALGMELLDAYTIRKVLPRILIAAVAITLSWPLMKFAIDFSNALGIGVRHLIYFPFRHIKSNIYLSFGSLFGGSGNVAGQGAGDMLTFLLGGIGSVGAIVGTVAFLPIILSYLATAALAVIIAIVVLILRQVIIIILVLLAPIAIVAYILPNTQNIYKIWWDSFGKALMMFPIIAAFIAAGRVFSAVTIASGTDIFTDTIGIAAYFAPYFLIPLTFRLAGGAVRQIGGLVNDRSRGGFDRLRQGRANTMKRKGEKYGNQWRTGGFQNPIPQRFKGLNRAAGKVVGATNFAGTHASSGLIRGGLGFGARGQKARERLMFQGAAHAAEDEKFKQASTSNAFMRLMAYTAGTHGDQSAAEHKLYDWYTSGKNEYGREFSSEDALGKVAEARAHMANVGGYNHDMAVASVMAAGRDGTAIRDVEDMAELVGAVSPTADVAYQLISDVGSSSRQRGRTELALAQDKRLDLAGAVTGNKPRDQVEGILRRATMSGAGGTAANAPMAQAPSRVIRGNVEHAMDTINAHMTVDGSVRYEDAVQAATVLSDYKNAAEMGGMYATTDNKIAFHTAMDVEDPSGVKRSEQLQEFLKTQVPVGATPAGKEIPILPVRQYDNNGNLVSVGGAGQQKESTAAYVTRMSGERSSRIDPDTMGHLNAEQAQQAQEQQDQANKAPGP